MFEGIYKYTIDICNKKNIFKIIPEFNEIHQQFRDVQTASKLPLYFYGDHFTKKWISLPCQEQFTFCWDVETLKRLIKQNKCLIFDFPIKELDHKYDDLYSLKVEQYKYQEEIDPIIVIGFYGTFMVVDGNHRLQSRIIRGEKSIKGFFAPYSIYTKAFYTKES